MHKLKGNDDIAIEGSEKSVDPKIELQKWHVKADEEMSKSLNHDPEISISPNDKTEENGTKPIFDHQANINQIKKTD